MATSIKAAGTLPLLDLALWKRNPLAFAHEFQRACHEIGFFLLRVPHNHTASEKNTCSPQAIATTALKETRRFFENVSIKDKMKISYQHNPSFRGYMSCGAENTAGKVDLREQVEYAREYDCSDSTNKHDDGEKFYKRLTHAKNPWPRDSQPTLQPAIDAHVDLLLDLSQQLRRAFCLALLYPPGESSSRNEALLQNYAQRLDDEFVDPHWVVKLVAYSSSSEQQHNDSSDSNNNINDDDNAQQQPQQGVGAHTDTNFMTLVLQDNVGGLQVWLRDDDEWIDVPTNSETKSSNDSVNDDDLILVCNLGESAQLYSGGYFCATPHRVLIRPSKEERRISVPFFYNPNLDTVVQALELPHDLPWSRPQGQARLLLKSKAQSDDDDASSKWRPSSNTMLSSVGVNTFKSLARSHPAVFAKHHGDLEILEDGEIVKRRQQKEQEL